MKLWQVTYEADGHTVKAPGVSETEIKRNSLYYAADTAEQVWEAIADLRADPERRFFSLSEALPLVIVLPSPVSEP